MKSVVAVMITGKCIERLPFAHTAVKCFMNQIYPNKELLIINHGVPMNVGGTHEIMVTRDKYPFLGDLRNLAIDVVKNNAPDSVITVWDDDDWYEPHYISEIMKGYQPGKFITCHKTIDHDLQQNASFLHRWNGGTYNVCMYDASTPYRYGRKDKHEDKVFRDEYKNTKNIVVVPNDPMFYVRMVHGFNVHTAEFTMRGHSAHPDVHIGLTPEQVAFVERVRCNYDWYLPKVFK
jgi:glycosyltransferase involved in cell wall biosynthesis